MDIQTAARKIVLDNIASDETRPHKTLFKRMALLLQHEIPCTEQEAAEAIERAADQVQADRTLENDFKFFESMSTPSPKEDSPIPGFIVFEQITEFSKEDWQKIMDRMNRQPLVAVDPATLTPTITPLDLVQRVIDLESALSALLNRHTRLVQAGWSPEDEPEVQRARELLEQAEQRDISEWLKE
jgi:hypothetical protein